MLRIIFLELSSKRKKLKAETFYEVGNCDKPNMKQILPTQNPTYENPNQVEPRKSQKRQRKSNSLFIIHILIKF